jgi:hypothetical protein
MRQFSYLFVSRLEGTADDPLLPRMWAYISHHPSGWVKQPIPPVCYQLMPQVKLNSLQSENAPTLHSFYAYPYHQNEA